MRNSALLACAILLSAVQVMAQSSDRKVVNESAQWFATTANLKLSNRLTWVLDGQYRYIESKPQQFQARTAIDIKINDHFSVIPLGYVYTWNSVYGGFATATSRANNEHRIWQQLFYKHDISRVKLDHRIRIEERFIQRKPDESYSANKQLRLRYRFMARVPLNHEKLDPNTWFASAYDEVFYTCGEVGGFGEHVTFNDIDQNRIFIGAGYQVDKQLSIQLGYIYQMLIKGTNGSQQENNTGFQLIATYNLNLMKAE
jgi:hypothetical protein